MGMYLMRQMAATATTKAICRTSWCFSDWKKLPWHWTFSDSFVATLILVFAVPGLFAYVFGYFAFRSRIKGVYFSILTQALTYAAMLLFFRNGPADRRQQRLHRFQAHPARHRTAGRREIA